MRALILIIFAIMCFGTCQARTVCLQNEQGKEMRLKIYTNGVLTSKHFLQQGEEACIRFSYKDEMMYKVNGHWTYFHKTTQRKIKIW